MNSTYSPEIKTKKASLGRIYPYLGLGVGLLGLGLAAVLTHLADAPATIVALYRTGIAALLASLPFYVRSRTGLKPSFRRGIPYAIAGGFLFSLDLIFWITGLTIGNLTNPTLMVNTAPLWVGLGTWLIFRKPPGKKYWLGLLIALLGVALVLVDDMLQATQIGLGTLLGLAGAVFYGAYFLVTQRGREYLSTISYFWISSMCACIFLLILNLLLKIPIAGYSVNTYLYLAMLGIFVHFIGWFGINYAQGHLPATIVSPTLLGQPVLTAVFASLLIGETFSGQQIFGGLLVLAGVYIVYRGQLGRIV